MSSKKCSVCGKATSTWGRYDLRDGYVCDDCFDKAKAIKKDISSFKTVTYTASMFKDILGIAYQSNEMQTESKFDTHTKKAGSALTILVKLSAFILIIAVLFAVQNHLTKKQDDVTEPNLAQNEIVDKNLSDDEYISLLKDLKPSGSTLTVDELFRKNYGIPQYKFTTENGEKYVLTRANSYAVCETLTFYFKITEYTDNTAFQPIKCILTDQVQMRDTELNQKNTENLLKTIFKN